MVDPRDNAISQSKFINRNISRICAYIVPKAKILLKFLLAQGTSSAINMLYGLMCIRILAVEEYSKYVVVFTVQSTITVLMDSGITGTIIPLIGERVNDNQLIADYIASLRALAHVLFAVVGGGVLFAFPKIIEARKWGNSSSCVILFIFLALTWFSRVTSAYGSVLIVKKDRRFWYKTQIYSSVIMLIALMLVCRVDKMTAISAMLINLGGIVFTAAMFYRRSRYHLNVKGVKRWNMQKSIIQLASPSIPGVIFYSFQGQVGVYALAFMGKSESVAGIGALSKVCQVTNYVSSMNPVLVEPFFARLEKRKVIKNAAIILSFASVFSCASMLFVKVFPEAFLWIIGPKYRGLRQEIFLAVIPGIMSLLGGMVASINSARRFNFYRFNVANIVMTIGVQIICVAKMDLSSLYSVLCFNVATGIPGFILVFLTLIYGLRFGGRRVEYDSCES